MSLTASEVWSRLLDRARIQLSDHIVNTWLAPLTAAEYSGEALTLNAPDQFSVEWNERRHSAILESLAPVAVGHPVKIALRVGAERLQRSQMDLFVPVKGQERSVIEPERPRENVNLSALNDRYTFDTFVVGKSNDLAAAAAAAVSQAPGKTYNPLFFYGPTGLGKTHDLVEAVARARQQDCAHDRERDHEGIPLATRRLPPPTHGRGGRCRWSTPGSRTTTRPFSRRMRRVLSRPADTEIYR